MLHISALIMNTLNTTESAFFIYLVYSLLPRDLTPVELGWLEHLKDYENMFETGVVRANDY